MRKMRLFYEAWAPVFEIRSAVSAEIKLPDTYKALPSAEELRKLL